jgi:quinoprotein glucose dehydrogenase
MLFEEGCHGIAFHPDFANNGRLYVSYSAADPRRTVLSEFHLASVDPLRVDPASERVLMEVPHAMANHFGGGLAFGPDRKLYLAIGDGGIRDDPYRTAQNPLMLFGKMLRLDVDARSGSLPYGIPADNPFADKQDVRPEIFALGLRNPWGFSFDAKTGDLWLADVGQDLWEKVNIIRKGANYGWSDRDGPTAAAFHATPFLPDRTYTEAMFAYTHAEGVSVTGGFVYRGERHTRLANCFLCGDWGYGTLWALRYDADANTITERLVLRLREQDSPPFNPTMIAAGVDGEPLIMSQEGAIYTLTEDGP